MQRNTNAALWLQVVAHSVGTWIAYELLVLARSRGLPMPRKAFLSAMASPDIADAARPWRRQRMLSDAEFQVHARVESWPKATLPAHHLCMLLSARQCILWRHAHDCLLHSRPSSMVAVRVVATGRVSRLGCQRDRFLPRHVACLSWPDASRLHAV